MTVIFVAVSCYTWSQSQQKVDDAKPMYGEVEKDERYKKIDNEFRKDMIERYGSIDDAVNEYINIAWALFYQNDLETAMRRFNQSWLLNPEYPDAYFGFAALLEMQGKKTEASRFYLTGAEKDRDNKRTIICLQRIAECKEQLIDLQGAIDALSKIRMLQPNDPVLYKKLGYLYIMTGNNDLAVEAYTKAIELDPKDVLTYHSRANLFQIMEDYLGAILDYDKSIRIDPTNVSSYVNRGILEMKTGNYDAATQDFQICIELDEKSGELRRLLGLAKLNSDNKQGACSDFKLAKELGDPLADEIINEYCK